MCRLSFSLLVLFSLCINAPAQEEPPGWVTLAPEGAGFSVLFPDRRAKEIYLITPASGLDALAYKRLGMRPAT